MSKEKDRAVAAEIAMHNAVANHGEGSAAEVAATDQADSAFADACRAGVSLDEIAREVDRRS